MTRQQILHAGLIVAFHEALHHVTHSITLRRAEFYYAVSGRTVELSDKQRMRRDHVSLAQGYEARGRWIAERMTK